MMENLINNQLLDENLIQIFGYLTKSDRIQCRVVCQRWFNLLVTDTMIFQSDWTLNLNKDCVIQPSEPPFTVITDSSVRYQSLSLDVNVRVLGETQEFWEKLGKTVTCLSFFGRVNTKMDQNLIKMMNFFNEVRTLIIDDSYETLKEIANTDVFPKVQTLILNQLIFQPSRILEEAIQKFTRLSSIQFGKSIDHFTLPMMMELKSQVSIEAAHINFDDWNRMYEYCITPDKTQVMIELLRVLRGNLKKLTFVSRSNDMECLKKILKENQEIREVKLVWTGIPTQWVESTLITELDVFIDFSSIASPNLNSLVTFKNLKVLKMTVKNSKMNGSVGCFYGHQVLKLNRLRKLSYSFYHSKVCPICQESLIKSCNLLESLKMDLGECLNSRPFLMELRSLKKLKLRNVSEVSLTNYDKFLSNPESIEFECDIAPDKEWSIDARSFDFMFYHNVKSLTLKGFKINQARKEFECDMNKQLPRLKCLNIDLCLFLSCPQ